MRLLQLLRVRPELDPWRRTVGLGLRETRDLPEIIRPQKLWNSIFVSLKTINKNRRDRSLARAYASGVNAGLGLQRNSNLLAAPLRSHSCLTASRGSIAIPCTGAADFASFGGVDPTLHLGIEGAFETVDEALSDLAPPASCTANIRPAVLPDVNDTFFENSLSRYLIPELRIYKDLYIGQYVALSLD
jgi:hypothetical protein